MAFRTYELGRWLVGFRTNALEVSNWLDEVLAGRRVEDDAADPYLSVRVAEPRPGAPASIRTFHMLLAEGEQIVRSLDLGVVARALLAEIELFLTQDRNDAVHLRAAVCEVNGARVLLPASIASFLGREGGRLAANGVVLPPVRGIAIDLGSGLARPVDPLLGDLDELVGDGCVTAGGPPAPIDVVCFVGSKANTAELSVAEAGQRLGSLATNLGPTGRQGLERLLGVAATTRRIELPALNSRETLVALVAAVDRVRPDGAGVASRRSGADDGLRLDSATSDTRSGR